MSNCCGLALHVQMWADAPVKPEQVQRVPLPVDPTRGF